jgi:hypothetical protein
MDRWIDVWMVELMAMATANALAACQHCSFYGFYRSNQLYSYSNIYIATKLTAAYTTAAAGSSLAK